MSNLNYKFLFYELCFYPNSAAGRRYDGCGFDSVDLISLLLPSFATRLVP